MPRPNPRALETISPTAAERLRRCRLKVAFDRDDTYASLRLGSTWASLGIATHELLEQVADGEFSECESPKDAMDAAWRSHIERQEKVLEAEPRLAAVPPARRWEGYEIARRRAVNLALADARLPRSGGSAGLLAQRESEVRLESKDGLVGRIDRIEHDGDRTALVDFKQGMRRQAAAMPSAYRRQLLVYAHLYANARGQLPGVIAIQFLDGSRLEVEPHAAEVEHAAKECIRLRDSFNEAIAHGVERLESETVPDEWRCSWCEYQVACEKFKSEVVLGWAIGRSFVSGDVESVETYQGGRRMGVRVAASNSLQLGELAGIRCTSQPAVEVGSSLDASFLSRRTRADSYDAAFDSRGWPPPSADAIDTLGRGEVTSGS